MEIYALNMKVFEAGEQIDNDFMIINAVRSYVTL